MTKRLERLRDEAKLGGVAAGLANYFNIDRTLVRVLFVAGFFLPHVPSLIIYIILWIVLPERVSAYSYSTYQSEPSTNLYTTMNSNERNGNLVGGAILVGIGFLFLLDRWFDINFGDMWPLILIGIGAWLIVKDRNKGSHHDGPPSNDRYTSGSDPYNTGTSDPYASNNPPQ
ncbi:PspC domain-containing protein [Larkinella rosea]|uniref:PspC domain-containing protein n=1 Tax=Larkinella rosea TaxID=2025312 RepID=A0A3P1C2D1_9BACT|nr:PspC domain-containing protein [Larkinella rosea]RRB07467.1 PspC domain-containing protein [Larkinella rosea]